LSVTWKNCWTKFQIFNLIEYDKIVFLDADVMVLKNLDHLFKKPHMTAALDGEYWNLWPSWPHFNSGCLVIEPSTDLFNNILNFAKTLPQEKIDSLDYVIAD
jgi:alpha-N-acetylglucosamine transferase